MVSGKNPLEINQTLRIDVTLEVGNVKDTVTVEGGASAVETENATVGSTVNGNAIYELPLNGRNTLDLLATQPGATPKNTDAPRQAGGYWIGGMRSDSVTYLLDGGNNNHLINNDVVINPNPDAVAEFRVLESNYSAEYGRNGGGVVSVVTKSGTNSVHGTAFDYLRNEDLDANTFFNNQQGIARQILKRNQYGGTLGGPIVHAARRRRPQQALLLLQLRRPETEFQCGVGQGHHLSRPLRGAGQFLAVGERRSRSGGGCRSCRPIPTSSRIPRWPRRASSRRPHQSGRAQLLQAESDSDLGDGLCVPGGDGPGQPLRVHGQDRLLDHARATCLA